MMQGRDGPTWGVGRGAGRRRAVGFTLVEMLVVLAIIAILTAIIVPSYQVMAAQNRRATCAANLKAIGRGLALFREDYQCFPPDATEYLWTHEGVHEYRSLYGVDPPGDHSDATITGAAYHPDGRPFVTRGWIEWQEIPMRGLGLYTLYYVGAYAAVLPSWEVEPRIGPRLRRRVEERGNGLNDEAFEWFRGAGYITELATFHCPASEAELNTEDLADRRQLPYLRGWNSYDMYYRRNFWNPQHQPMEWEDQRHLLQPYPPADTVITWCPYHRASTIPPYPGMAGEPVPGDEDLVLFADGSVRRMTSQRLNRMYEEPAAGGGWPEGPVM